MEKESSSSSSSSSSSETNEFEFGFTRPKSSSSDPEREVSSPADEFFFNGRLLPHSFPETQSRNSTRRSSSSSISSRDSLSSRNSSISSSSDIVAVAERKEFQRKLVSKERLVAPNQEVNGSKKCNYVNKLQRWQIISISPSPSGSRRRRSCGEIGFKMSPKKMMKESYEEKGFCLRILRSFVKSCKACHAMEEGAAMEEDDIMINLEMK